MDTNTIPVFNVAMTEICHDVIAAVAEHPGDSPARRAIRQQAVADTMVSLEPHTPMESILAGHCLVFDHLIRESAHQLLNCQEERIRLRVRPQVCGSARMFLAALEKFEQWHARTTDQLVAETAIETRAAQPARRAAPPAQTRSAEPARAEAAAPGAIVAPDQRGQATRARAEVNQPPPESQAMSSPEASNPSPGRVGEHADAATAQIRPDSPFAAERELAMALARPGLTTAAMNEHLLAAFRDAIPAEELARARQLHANALAPGGNRAQDTAETNSSTATHDRPGSAARAKRADEPV
jgi:hypothetical protein